MKNFLLLLILSTISLLGKSQVLTGVYKGKMVSDSLKYSVDFELTLKEKNGELYGYCQRLFLIDDVLYYNLVKVKARIKDSVLIVEDEKSVSNNFEQKTKGIKTVYMFNIKDIVDTASVLNGDWSTSSWRNLYAMPGKLVVNRERNYLATQLYKRLEEKKLTKEMMFDEPRPVFVSTATKPQPTDVVVNKPTNNPTTNSSTQTKQEIKTAKDTVVTNAVAVTKPEEVKPKANDVVVNQPSDKPTTIHIQTKPVVTSTKDSSNKTNVAANNQQPSSTKPNDVAVNQANNKPPVTKPVKTQQTTNNTNKPSTTPGNTNVAATTTQEQNKPVVKTPADSTNKASVAVNNPQQTKPQQTTVAVNQPNNKPTVTNQSQTQSTVATNKPATTNPVVTNQPQPKPQQTSPAVTTPKSNTAAATTSPQTNTSTVTNKPVDTKPTAVVTTTPVANQPLQNSISTIGNVNAGNTASKPEAGKPPVINNPVIVKRQLEIIDALEVSEDSVTLSLYDNGEIDGDTVSVFLNNELIVSRVGIKASAYKKTIAVPKGEIIQLTLFAENLGSIPPNTGLLIITTTNERYQVNFSSTLNKSSSIVLKRKE